MGWFFITILGWNIPYFPDLEEKLSHSEKYILKKKRESAWNMKYIITPTHSHTRFIFYYPKERPQQGGFITNEHLLFVVPLIWSMFIFSFFISLASTPYKSSFPIGYFLTLFLILTSYWLSRTRDGVKKWMIICFASVSSNLVFVYPLNYFWVWIIAGIGGVFSWLLIRGGNADYFDKLIKLIDYLYPKDGDYKSEEKDKQIVYSKHSDSNRNRVGYILFNALFATLTGVILIEVVKMSYSTSLLQSISEIKANWLSSLFSSSLLLGFFIGWMVFSVVVTYFYYYRPKKLTSYLYGTFLFVSLVFLIDWANFASNMVTNASFMTVFELFALGMIPIIWFILQFVLFWPDPNIKYPISRFFFYYIGIVFIALILLILALYVKSGFH